MPYKTNPSSRELSPQSLGLLSLCEAVCFEMGLWTAAGHVRWCVELKYPKILPRRHDTYIYCRPGLAPTLSQVRHALRRAMEIDNL